MKGSRTVVFHPYEVKKKVRLKVALSLSQIVFRSYYLSEQFFCVKGVFYVVDSALFLYASNRTSYLVSSYHSGSEVAHAGRRATLE